jgi:Tfp pilus assembly protein PilE
MRCSRNRRNTGFTLVELLLLLTIVSVLGLIVVSALAGAEAKARRITCLDNLRKLGAAFNLYAHHHHGMYPMEFPSSEAPAEQKLEEIQEHFKALPEVNLSMILICPSDSRQPSKAYSEISATNLSYFHSPGGSQSDRQ